MKTRTTVSEISGERLKADDPYRDAKRGGSPNPAYKKPDGSLLGKHGRVIGAKLPDPETFADLADFVKALAKGVKTDKAMAFAWEKAGSPEINERFVLDRLAYGTDLFFQHRWSPYLNEKYGMPKDGAKPSTAKASIDTAGFETIG